MKKKAKTKKSTCEQKITEDMIINWNGMEEFGLAGYLCAILNNEFSIEDARKEISSYVGKDTDEED